MREARRRIMWQAIVFGIASACGDDGSKAVVTGFPSEQKLSTLSDTELQKACHALDDGASARVTPADFAGVACLQFGLQAGATASASGASVDVTKCQQTVDLCVKELTKDDGEVGLTTSADDQDEDCDDARASDVAGCDVTVGEYEACFNALLNEIEQKFFELRCQNAELVMSKTYDREIHPEQLPQCQTIATKCPDAELGIPFAGKAAEAGASE